MISQTLLAVPMWLLYEVGIVFSRKYKSRITEAGVARDKRYDEEEDEAEPDPEDDPTPDGSGSGGAAVKGAPRSEAHKPEYEPPRPNPQAATKGNDSKAEKPAEEKPDIEKPGYVKPSLIEKPDAHGVYRNSLTDFDEAKDTSAKSGKSDATDSPNSEGDKPEQS
jgi:sec-independent protein translocase protein TatC